MAEKAFCGFGISIPNLGKWGEILSKDSEACIKNAAGLKNGKTGGWCVAGFCLGASF